MSELRLIDARGLLCPWPALRLARAAREMGGQGSVRMLADDPIAPAELAKLCEERGWRISPASDDEHGFEIRFD